jgi:hypothetical protein
MVATARPDLAGGQVGLGKLTERLAGWAREA